MNTDNYDIYFPHLGIGVEHLGNSISVFGFRIAYYGIIIGIGMLMGVLIASFDYKRRGQKSEDIEDLALYSIIFAILGARAYYVIFEWDYYSQHLGEILNLRQGGLAIYGGILTGILCCVIFCYRRKVKFFSIADSASHRTAHRPLGKLFQCRGLRPLYGFTARDADQGIHRKSEHAERERAHTCDPDR